LAKNVGLLEESIVQTLSAALQLPVSLYEGERCLLSLPTHLTCAARLLGKPGPLECLKPSHSQLHAPQFLESPYGEKYLYVEFDAGRALLLGAFLSEALESKDVYHLIRSLRLSTGDYQPLLRYYRSLPVMEEARFFYLGQLLDMLFTRNRAVPFPGAASPHALEEQRRFQNTFKSRIQLFSHPPFYLEQEITHHIAGGDRKNALRVLAEINALPRATLAQDPLRSLKNSLICSCALFTRAAIAGGASADDAFTLSDACIQSLEEANDLRSMAALEEPMMLSFIELVEARTQHHLSPVTRAAIQYIDDHLTDKITLASIAQAVYVHPSYLSQRFKQDTGDVISSFIQRRRVTEAKHFIRYTNDPISQIAGFYQFCSQSHFIQVFKKHAGITPQAYRSTQDSAKV
jgi:AraC-like DNA-binding protein